MTYITHIKGGFYMEKIQLALAYNLKSLRETRKLTLEKLAEITGVSKTMLGQIERGESSPTITTLWKIADGLKVSFTALVNMPSHAVELIRQTDCPSILADEGRYEAFLHFPTTPEQSFEVYTIHMAQYAYHQADPHQIGTIEFITIFQGTLALTIGDETHVLTASDSIRFNANQAHSYKNVGDDLIQMNVILYYS